MSHFNDRGGVEREFAIAIGALAEALLPQGQSISPTRIALYASALEDLPIEAIKHACIRAISESKFFPVPSELRSYVQPSVDDAASIAWTAFQRAAETVGAYQSLEVDDQAAVFAFRSVFATWESYCSLDERAIGVRRQDFFASYREGKRILKSRPDHPTMRIVGILEAGGDYPTGDRRALVWHGRIDASGNVSVTRETPKLLEGRRGNDDARSRLALEAGTEKAIEAPKEATRVDEKAGRSKGLRRS